MGKKIVDFVLEDEYINKHSINCNIVISIDGTKEKHDLNRVKKDGTGSYDDIEKILP